MLHAESTYDVNEKVVLFTEESLQNCHTKKEIRDSLKKRPSKFDTITLPLTIDGKVGYHTRCYRYFCSVKSSKQTDIVEESSMLNRFLKIKFNGIFELTSIS